jgi:hypothetical protein
MRVTSPAPVKKYNMHREHDIQAACVRWMQYQYPREATMLFAIPNGAHLAGTAKQRAAHWARLEREGAKAGVPDLFLAIPRRQAHGLFIEMKAERGMVRPAQDAWLQALSAQGYEAAVCRSLEEFQAVVREYLFEGWN